MEDVASALAALLATGGWHLEEGAGYVNDALHVSFHLRNEDDTLKLVFRTRAGGGMSIDAIAYVARYFMPEGAPIRFEVVSKRSGVDMLLDLHIESCMHDSARANCVLREADIRLKAKEFAEQQLRLGALHEAAARSRRPTDGSLELIQLEDHTVPAPPGWVPYKSSYKHVRTGTVVGLQRGKTSDGATWTFAAFTSKSALPEAALVTAKAFVGEGKRVVLALAQGSTDAVSVAYCHDRERADSVPVEREAIAARITSDPRLSRIAPRDDGDRWERNSPVPLAYAHQWSRVLSEAGFSYRHHPAAMSVTERMDPVADERAIVVASLDETWSLERIMEAATSFIKRGTRVRVTVDEQPTVTFHHGVHHELVDGELLDEDAIEQALAPHRQRLRATKASDEAALSRARMKRERRASRTN
jgi:hypothetical protein